MYFFEFEPLCQMLWAFMSNFDNFYDVRSPNMAMSSDPRSKYGKNLFFLNSAFNIRKGTKFLFEKFSTSEVISEKPHGGGKHHHRPVLLGLMFLLMPL